MLLCLQVNRVYLTLPKPQSRLYTYCPMNTSTYSLNQRSFQPQSVPSTAPRLTFLLAKLVDRKS